MIKNGDGCVEETLGQMSSHSECTAPKVPERRGVLQESSTACGSCIPETAAAPTPNSDDEGLQQPSGSKQTFADIGKYRGASSTL